MVSSHLATLVDAAWPAISAAVRKGLKEDGQELTKLVTVVKRPDDLGEHVSLGWSSPPTSGSTFSEQTLTATAGAVSQLRVARQLERSDLDPEPGQRTLRDLTDWATAARAAEHRWVLGRIRGIASSAGVLDDGAVDALGLGWRVIVFSTVDGLEERCRARGIDPVARDAASAPACAALAVPVAALAVARVEDLTPTFDYTDTGISVTLSERIELIGFTPTAGARRYDSIGTITPPT
jgi:hypothetical protein